MSDNQLWPPTTSELRPVLLAYGSLSSDVKAIWKEAAKHWGAQIISTERFDECLLHAAGSRPICLVVHLKHALAYPAQSARLTNQSDPVFRRITVVLLTETPEQTDQWRRIAWDALGVSSSVEQVELALAASIETARLRLKDQALVADYYRRHDELTPEEVVILDAVCDGKLNKQIARELNVSIRTVEQRRRRVFDKMGVESAIPLSAQVATVQTLEHQSSRRDSPAIPPTRRVAPPGPHTGLLNFDSALSPLSNARNTKSDR